MRSRLGVCFEWRKGRWQVTAPIDWRIKGGVIFLVIGAAAVTGMCYHKELQETIAAKISPAKTVAAATDANSADTNNLVIAPGLKGMTQAPNKVSASLVTAQANAQLRDSIIDQMGK